MDTQHTPSSISRIHTLGRSHGAPLFLLIVALIFPLTGLTDTFPDSPFNGMQISYSISGAQVTETTDVGGFTTSRTLKGILTSPGTLSVSGTVGMGNGYYADAVVSVSAGGKTESWTERVETGFPGMNTKSFSVSVPVPEGTETGSVSIRMTGYYNAGTRGLVVSGGFTIPIPDGIKQAPDQAGGRGDNPQTAYFPECPKPGKSGQGLPGYTVNTSLLNLVIDDMDFGCQSYDHDQALRRIWSMNPDQIGMFGRGWAFAYESRILAKPYKTGGAKVTVGSGQVIDYEVAKSEDGGLGIIFVDYSRTSKGLGADLSAQLDDTSGTGIYYLTDKRTKQTWVYKYIKQVSGSNLYLLESILDRNGNAIQLTYDDQDRLATISDVSERKTVFSYDSNSRCTRMDTFDGRAATYQYDYRGNLTQSIDLAGNVITYGYDYYNYMTSMTVAGKTTQFAYATKVNDDRYISTVTEPDGQVWRYKLNKDGSTQVTEPGGGVTTYANSSGRTTLVKNTLNQSLTKEFNDQFLPVKVTDALGRITILTYDADGNLIRSTDSTGQSTTYTYDDHWNVTQTANALGQITEYSYDGNDNLIAEKSPRGSITRYEVDAKGQVIRVTRPDGASLQMRYDAHGNLIGMTDPLGNVTEFGFDSYGLNPSTLRDALGNTTGYSFDANRRLTSINQANGNRIQYNRDCCSLTSVQDGAGHTTQYERDQVYRLTKTTDPLGQTSLFAYNADGDLTGTTDPLSHTRQIAYDAIHQPTVLTDPLGGTVQFSRDAVGNVTAVTDERGKVTTMSYDDRNLLSTIKDPLGKTTARYTRDALGRITGIINARGDTVGLVYDADGRLVRKQYNGVDVTGYVWDVNDQLTAVIDASGTKTFTREAAGRITRITYPDGKTIGFAFDANGNRSTVTYPDGLTATYTYDSLNRVASVSFAGNILNLSYDAVGNLIGEIRSNGANSSYSYDAANQLIRVNHQRGGAVIADITYTRNAAGLITQESGTWPLSPSHPFEDATATHDDANAIVTWNGDSHIHDADGNLTGITGSRSFAAQYDPENRPTAITRSGSTTQYAYDGLNNRVRGQSPSLTRQYYHDESGMLLTDIDTTNNVVTHYIHAGSRLVAAGSAGKGYVFHHFDKTGNTLALTDATGQVVGAFGYDAYGKVVARSGSVSTPFTYVGAYGVIEGAENLFFMRNRYYDAVTGRFIQRDPIGFSSGQINLYEYVSSNPITSFDPIGLWDAGDVLAVGLGALTAIGIGAATAGTAGVAPLAVFIASLAGGTVMGTGAHVIHDSSRGKIGTTECPTYTSSILEGAGLGFSGAILPSGYYGVRAIQALEAAIAAAKLEINAAISAGNPQLVRQLLVRYERLLGRDYIIKVVNAMNKAWISHGSTIYPAGF